MENHQPNVSRRAEQSFVKIVHEGGHEATTFLSTRETRIHSGHKYQRILAQTAFCCYVFPNEEILFQLLHLENFIIKILSVFVPLDKKKVFFLRNFQTSEFFTTSSIADTEMNSHKVFSGKIIKLLKSETNKHI